MTRYALVVDLNRCVGCQTCTAACKHANATAPGVQWRRVLDFETGRFPDVRRAFLPVGCMHCDAPPCLDVCPSTATGKRADGIVTIDYDICIGCAYCAVACPYQARFRVDAPASAYGGRPMRHERARENPARLGVAQKCTLCVERIDDGLARGLVPGVDAAATPACVNSCIAGALFMGDLDDPESNVSRLLRENRHFRMHEDLGTGPGIVYLYDGEIGQAEPAQPAPMVAEPVGLERVSPQLQTSWDWRAAMNFILGGAGTGLFAWAALAALAGAPLWGALFLALALVGTGLLCVWLEIGRPWRFLNVLRHPQRSWMTREALAAVAFLALGGLGWLLQAPSLTALAALAGLGFLYAQARILRAAKGIPAWRQGALVPLMVATGLTEGAALYLLLAALAGPVPPLWIAALLILTGLRLALWRRYRRALRTAGAPTAAIRALETGALHVLPAPQAAVALLLAAGLYFPLAGLAGAALALATGWGFKFRLITGAAYNQGYAIERMPARGAGHSAPGIRPGWTRDAEPGAGLKEAV